MSLSLHKSLQFLLLLGLLSYTPHLAAQDDAAEEPAPPAVEEPAEQPAEEPVADGEQPAEPEAPEAPAAEDKPADEAPAEDKPTDDKPAEEEPADEEPADEKPAEEPAAPEAGATDDLTAADAFAAKLNDWKALLKDMRALQVEYREAEEAELPALRDQWGNMVERGQQMLPELRELGMAAFKESPGTDRQLARFLVKMAGDAMAADRWEVAHDMSTQLLAAEVEDESLLQVAGVSSFVLNEYDDAEKYLTQAKEAGTLSPQWEGYLAELEDYKKYWAEEQKLRDEESKAGDLPKVEMKTSAGTVVLELFENQAPQTVGNFVSLVEDGFYDGIVFHRVIPNFMAQGGDPEGTGGGGPGYTIYDEVDRDDTRMHFRGSLSMAKTAAPDSGGSQFFLTFVPTTHLNKKHTVFGRVVEGMDVLAEIERDPGPDGKNATVIESAKVLNKRDHEYKPTKVE